MDTKKFIEKFSLKQFPLALGGCRNDGTSYESCEYDITVFDEKNENDSIIDFENDIIRLHHGSLKETRPEILIQYSNLQILWDEKWELKIFLSQISEKKEKFFNSYTKNCLVESAVCATKAKECIKNSNPFASSWVKCAAYYLADAITLNNHIRPSPAHMLEHVRKLGKTQVNEKFIIVNECVGIERATHSLLTRMCKSTIGFSDLVEKNNHSKIIQNKHDYFVKKSLISDCYFYLGYINRDNFMKIKDGLHRTPELIHILKVAFDVENDMTRLEQQASTLHKTSNELLSILN
ncbi:MAG: hypothetical protein ACE5RN_07290 [Nitrosopumilaceae archaeon]